MRRSEKEISDRELIDKIINNSLVCRLGLSKDNFPYVIPVSFGYDGTDIFLHTALDGLKIEYIKSNNKVCFEFEDEVKLVKNETSACNWSFSFYSVIGFGKIFEITDAFEKEEGLNHIMVHYSGKSWTINKQSLTKTRVWKIQIDQITGKQSKDKIII